MLPPDFLNKKEIDLFRRLITASCISLQEAKDILGVTSDQDLTESLHRLCTIIYHSSPLKILLDKENSLLTFALSDKEDSLDTRKHYSNPTETTKLGDPVTKKQSLTPLQQKFAALVFEETKCGANKTESELLELNKHPNKKERKNLLNQFVQWSWLSRGEDGKYKIGPVGQSIFGLSTN